MQYLIAFGGGAIILGSLIINKLFNKKANLVVKIIAVLAMALFFGRMYCYTSFINANKEIFKGGLSTSPLHNDVLTAFSLLFIWGSYTLILFTLMNPFFNVKFGQNIVRFIGSLFFLIQPFFLGYESLILAGPEQCDLLLIFFSIETAFGMGLSLYYLISFFIDKEKTNIKDIAFMFLGIVLLSIFTMPSYMPSYLFGVPNTILLWHPIDLNSYHRIMIYIGFIVPLVIHFSLTGRDYDFKRYVLLFMNLGVMCVFMLRYDYTSFLKPWAWPFHLCNTAVFILPLVLCFKMKRLFYFTYFINVLGAFFAMIMPNYGDEAIFFDVSFIAFWYNHYAAFFMPLLLVSLKIFERPKLKQFIFSMCWFAFYFALVLVLNVVFNAMDPTLDCDYFFINSDFIAEKLGGWAEKIWALNVTLNVGGLTLTFRPLYQSLYFVVYILLGLCVWFIYSEAYRVADSNALIFLRLKRMRTEDKELKKALAGRKVEEPMEKDAGIKYELKNFSKRYGQSKRFAVKDASFEVHGGEIFGFLGPNGAGKSTIIKSTVGIQPITSGNINICGYDMATQPVQCKALMGFVPDHYALYEKLTGREYVNYIADIYGVSKEDRDARIEPLVKRFELEASFDNMIKTYSHGMKQKITIMSALVHDPKVWILDEPLTGLDPNSIYQVKECMKEHAARGNIVFFSSHIIDIVEKLCQRIAIIKHGHIQCIKTVEEIEASGKTLEQFYLETIGDNEDDEVIEEEVKPEEPIKKHRFTFKRKEK